MSIKKPHYPLICGETDPLWFATLERADAKSNVGIGPTILATIHKIITRPPFQKSPEIFSFALDELLILL